MPAPRHTSSPLHAVDIYRSLVLICRINMIFIQTFCLVSSSARGYISRDRFNSPKSVIDVDNRVALLLNCEFVKPYRAVLTISTCLS